MSSVQAEAPLRYDYFFDTSGELLCVLNGEGRILRANRAFFHVLGRDEGSMAGEDFAGLVRPEDAGPARELFASTERRLAVLHFNARFIHQDGSDVELSFVLRRAAGEAEIYATGRESGNVPAHEWRRRWLLVSKMQQTAKVGGWDVEAGTLDQYWTEETYRIHELPFSHVPGVDTGIASYAPEHQATIAAAFGAAMNEGKPYDLELQLVTTTGRRVWVRTAGVPIIEDGKVVRVMGAFQDIDEFKRRELELEEKLAIIERQRSEIQALSAPIIQVWDDVLALPVVGALDRDRAEEITGRLLEAVVRSRTRYAILDLTGVESVDEVTADHVGRILRAIQLLGAEGLVTGIRPAVAQTLTALGAGFEGVRTLSNLREAISVCMRERAAGRGASRR